MQPDTPSFRPNSGVVCAELDGEFVLLQIDTGIYYGLDEVGTQVWNCLESSGTIDSTVSTLLSTYDVSRDRLQNEVSELIDKLLKEQLLVQC